MKRFLRLVGLIAFTGHLFGFTDALAQTPVVYEAFICQVGRSGNDVPVYRGRDNGTIGAPVFYFTPMFLFEPSPSDDSTPKVSVVSGSKSATAEIHLYLRMSARNLEACVLNRAARMTGRSTDAVRATLAPIVKLQVAFGSKNLYPATWKLSIDRPLTNQMSVLKIFVPKNDLSYALSQVSNGITFKFSAYLDADRIASMEKILERQPEISGHHVYSVGLSRDTKRDLVVNE